LFEKLLEARSAKAENCERSVGTYGCRSRLTVQHSDLPETGTAFQCCNFPVVATCLLENPRLAVEYDKPCIAGIAFMENIFAVRQALDYKSTARAVAVYLRARRGPPWLQIPWPRFE